MLKFQRRFKMNWELRLKSVIKLKKNKSKKMKTNWAGLGHWNDSSISYPQWNEFQQVILEVYINDEKPSYQKRVYSLVGRAWSYLSKREIALIVVDQGRVVRISLDPIFFLSKRKTQSWNDSELNSLIPILKFCYKYLFKKKMKEYENFFLNFFLRKNEKLICRNLQAMRFFHTIKSSIWD